MIHAYVFTFFHGLLFVLWCRRERAIREMRRIHAEQLAAEQQCSRFWRERAISAVSDLSVAQAALARRKGLPS